MVRQGEGQGEGQEEDKRTAEKGQGQGRLIELGGRGMEREKPRAPQG